jgi:hypothetical protein
VKTREDSQIYLLMAHASSIFLTLQDVAAAPKEKAANLALWMLWGTLRTRQGLAQD